MQSKYSTVNAYYIFAIFNSGELRKYINAWHCDERNLNNAKGKIFFWHNCYWWEVRELHRTTHATNTKSKYMFVPTVRKTNTFAFSNTSTDCTQSVRPAQHSPGHWSYSRSQRWPAASGTRAGAGAQLQPLHHIGSPSATCGSETCLQGSESLLK